MTGTTADTTKASGARRTRARRGEGERLREEILDATERLLIETSDADAVSIRAIAEAVGVTPPSIYMHFASKEELVLQACERQFQALGIYVGEATAKVDDPVEALKAMGHAYVRFGLEHPEQYRFLFMNSTPEWAVAAGRERIEELSGFWKLVAAVSTCVESGAFRPGDPFTIACSLWVAVHGVTSLFISKPFFPFPDGLVDECLDVWCRGLEARSSG